MADDLVKRARDGVIERPKRWTGDTHDDLGGSVDYDATDALMHSLAARIESQEAALQAADELADAAQRLEHIARQNTDNAKVWEDACEAVCAALASYRKARGGEAP